MQMLRYEKPLYVWYSDPGIAYIGTFGQEPVGEQEGVQASHPVFEWERTKIVLDKLVNIEGENTKNNNLFFSRVDLLFKKKLTNTKLAYSK